MRIRRAAVVLSVLAATGCSSGMTATKGAVDTPSASDVPPPATAETTPSAEATPTADTPSASDVPPPATAETTPSAEATPTADAAPAKVGVEGFTYENRLKVQVLKLGRFTASDTAAGHKPGNVVVVATVKITNGTNSTLDLSAVQVDIKAGADGNSTEAVYDSANGLGGGFTGSVAAGRNATARFGFDVAPADATDLVVEVTPSFDYKPALFQGSS